MELFAKLFCSLLVFVYHCFDRVGRPQVSERAAPLGGECFFPGRGRGSHGGRDGVEQTKPRVPGMGGGVRPQSQRAHKVGPKKGYGQEVCVRPRLRRMERDNHFGVFLHPVAWSSPAHRINKYQLLSLESAPLRRAILSGCHPSRGTLLPPLVTVVVGVGKIFPQIIWHRIDVSQSRLPSTLRRIKQRPPRQTGFGNPNPQAAPSPALDRI